MCFRFPDLLNIIKQDFLNVQIKHFCCNTMSKWTQPTGNATDILIYNRITQTKVPFITKSRDFISWYACGPTVYDSAHVGHACTYVRFDIIRRILEKYTKMKVIQVMSVTDIDDKIIKRAKENNTDWRILSNVYEKEFFEDLASLNVKKPTVVSRATDFIPHMLKFINILLNKQIAYTSPDGSVYFSIEKYGKHGKFRKTGSSPSESSTRKKNPLDFALWKNAKPGEPSWESPWGAGRPGWHIECSTIASQYFGNVIDVHSGGIDLIFPHHENEESQSCAVHGVDQWVNYWIHTGHLNYKSEKMSKSLKNFVSVKEYLSMNSFNHLRMLCLYTNYRTDVDLCGEEILHSINMCIKFYQFFDECRAYIQGCTTKGDVDSNRLLRTLNETKENICRFLKDDFDTRSSVCALMDLMQLTNSMLIAEPGNRCVISVSLVYLYVEDLFGWLGLDFSSKFVSNVEAERSAECISNIIDTSVSFRSNVRNTALSMTDTANIEIKKKLLNLCDQVRAEYNHYGVAVKDRKNDASTWSYVQYDKNENKENENTQKEQPS